MAKTWGLEFPEARYRKFGVFVIQHKKKIVSVLMKKSNWMGLTYKERPERTCEVIARAMNQLLKAYPELKK